MAENNEPGAAGAPALPSALQLLRRAAGYSTAAGFAQAIAIPTATYRRYEQCAPTPDTAIPMKPAWVIADKLNCSIDEVVGRTRLASLSTAYQRIHAHLSQSSQELLSEYVAYLMYRDRLLRLTRKIGGAQE